jgi:AraC-like DNA-binding protein
MRASAGPGEFGRDPVGRYVVGEGFLCWCLDPTLFGCVYWGRFEREHAERLVAVLDAELHPAITQHASFADMRRLEAATPAAFELLATYLASPRDRLARAIRRQAILRPSGMIGSLVAGFYEVHGAPYPARSFTDPADALGWLGVDVREGPALLARLDELQAIATRTPDLVRAVRGVLRARLRDPALDDVARELGVSRRTLQRRLGEAGTSFQRELAHARIDAAKELLETRASLTAVAIDVGCASLQHFSCLFRKITGEPPSAWRARRRDLEP